jgi:hypothetical protein
MEINSQNGNLIIYAESVNGKSQVVKRIIKSNEFIDDNVAHIFKSKKIKVKKINVKQNEDVYDICIKDNRNFFANNVLVHNCFEIGFIPVTEDGRCGVQFCNLTSINGAKIKTIDDFVMAAKAATLIGTLQASYTNYPYLSNAAKLLTEEEALLGVSITGVMDNPDILLNLVI